MHLIAPQGIKPSRSGEVMGTSVSLIDSAHETSQEVDRVLGKLGIRNASSQAVAACYIVTDAPERIAGNPAASALPMAPEALVFKRLGATALKRTLENWLKLLARNASDESRAALIGAM